MAVPGSTNLHPNGDEPSASSSRDSGCRPEDDQPLVDHVRSIIQWEAAQEQERVMKERLAREQSGHPSAHPDTCGQGSAIGLQRWASASSALSMERFAVISPCTDVYPEVAWQFLVQRGITPGSMAFLDLRVYLAKKVLE